MQPIVGQLIAGAIGMGILVLSQYTIYVRGMLQSARKVNDHLLQERDAVIAQNKELKEQNEIIKRHNELILNKPFVINVTPEIARDFANYVGPYLVPGGSKLVN